ncbi:MAG: hypothetical protein KME08_12025 [Aphanothece sp. CMT-3BRIN-NPC111]|jgi:hypothetical protein|nr:hypothetical protein [Aphanothece sp. CMT-3BRIN-NPC111]
MTDNAQSHSEGDSSPEHQPFFRVRPLINASAEEVGQSAIDYTRDQFTILSGTPEVVLTRRMTAAEFSVTGLGQMGFGGGEPPIMLVVVKGDFDVSNFGRFRAFDSSSSPTQVKYIGYVFDLRAGMPCLTATGLTGEYFRRALNDPSLPD